MNRASAQDGISAITPSNIATSVRYADIAPRSSTPGSARAATDQGSRLRLVSRGLGTVAMEGVWLGPK